MKKFMKFLVPMLLSALIIASCFWYLFIYDRDFTRDTLLSQARYIEGNNIPNQEVFLWRPDPMFPGS